MAKLQNLQQIRENIRNRIAVENLVKQSNGDSKPLYNAMAIVPEGEMWHLVQWLTNDILPKIEKHRGADSLEMKNYTAVRNAIIFSLYISSAYEKLLTQVGNDKFLCEVYREKMLFLERELAKYTTTEILLQSEALADYRNGLINRALAMVEPPIVT